MISSKGFSLSLEHFFLTVGQNNFGNKIPFFLQIQAEAGLRRPVLGGASWYWMLRPASAWICIEIKNALQNSYKCVLHSQFPLDCIT